MSASSRPATIAPMIAFSRTGGIAVPAFELAQLLEEVVPCWPASLGWLELAVAVGVDRPRRPSRRSASPFEVRGLVLGLKAAGDQQKRREQQERLIAMSRESRE